ncbi:MAG: TspO/MBR family protein [Patescibacteria group bacterium]
MAKITTQATRDAWWAKGLTLGLAILACEVLGASGSLFTGPEIETWYATLTRPEIAPPNWVFAPVWTTLFAFMGIAAWLVWRQGLGVRQVKLGLAVFAWQFALNILWSAVFFGLHEPGAALGVILALWLSIAGTMLAFYKVSRPAAWLLLPYLLWVSFATYLNYAFWLLNS